MAAHGPYLEGPRKDVDVYLVEYGLDNWKGLCSFIHVNEIIQYKFEHDLKGECDYGTEYSLCSVTYLVSILASKVYNSNGPGH